MLYQHMFDNQFTKVCLYISSWDVTKCSFMSITEAYKWFFIIGFYLRVVKMRFSLKGILDMQEARRHLYFSRKTSRKYIFSMSVFEFVGSLYKSFVRRKICTSDATKSSLISNYNFWITHNPNFRENMMPQKLLFSIGPHALLSFICWEKKAFVYPMIISEHQRQYSNRTPWNLSFFGWPITIVLKKIWCLKNCFFR